MPKRFTDTDIWGEDWFLALEPAYMMFWKYITDHCDHAGIWKPNSVKFTKLTGYKIEYAKAIQVYNDGKERIIILNNGRWFLTGFIPFQYGCKLNLFNRVHKAIYELLLINGVKLTSIRPQVEVGQGVKDKDKEKDISSKDFKDFNILIHNRFEEIWKKYPNKDGKKAAFKHFVASVKTDADWNDINKALENYLHCDKVKKGFIKDGSTWFNNWQDWVIDPTKSYEPELPKLRK